MIRFLLWRRRGLEAWVIGCSTVCSILLFFQWHDSFNRSHSLVDAGVMIALCTAAIIGSFSFASALWNLIRDGWGIADQNPTHTTYWVDRMLRRIRNTGMGLALIYYGVLLFTKICRPQFAVEASIIIALGLVLRLWACLYDTNGEVLEDRGPYVVLTT